MADNDMKHEKSGMRVKNSNLNDELSRVTNWKKAEKKT